MGNGLALLAPGAAPRAASGTLLALIGGISGACASGAVQVFLFAGATPADVTRQHATLTGVTPLPPLCLPLSLPLSALCLSLTVLGLSGPRPTETYFHAY